MENLFNNIQDNIEFLEKKIEQYRNDCEASKAEFDKPFAYEDELRSKIARQSELNTLLDLENGKVEDVDLGGIEEDRNVDNNVAECKVSYMESPVCR